MPPQRNPLPTLPNLILPLLLLLLITHPPPTTAASAAEAAHEHSNGLDPAMDMPMPLAHGHMSPFLHLAPGDTLWLDGWVPGRGTALLGACVGLFLLGVAERWVGAVRAGVEGAIWRDAGAGGIRLRRDLSSSTGEQQNKNKKTKKKCISGQTSEHPPLSHIIFMRPGTLAPFVADHAWARYVLHAAQASMAILFMLAVMTFQVSFILSIVVGLGVGEAMYGRFVDAMRVRVRDE